jgi:predicted transglutaminase-like cysteine proteinase
MQVRSVNLAILGVGVALLLPVGAQARVHQAHPAGRVQTVEVLPVDEAAPSIHGARVGAVTRVPYGWADFCTRRPEECRVDVLEPVEIVANARTLSALREINEEVNDEIEPVSNLDHWGTILDHWDYPADGKGDCKIYALWKRKRLLDLGFPRQALLMTIVRDLDGNGHTILTVKTDRGDLVLDNMVGEIRFWDETGYKFVKRQSQSDPNVWVSIGPTAMPVTTAGVR